MYTERIIKVMNKDEAYRILELLKDVDFNYAVPSASTLGHVRANQLELLGKALDTLVKEYNENK